MKNPFRRRGACELGRSLPKNPSVVNMIIRIFSASAFLNNSPEIVKAPQRSRCGPDAFAEPVLERLLLGRPHRESAGRESVPQQVKSGGDSGM